MANNAMPCSSDLPFHQGYAPKSMKWYDLEALDKNEQTNLNKLKLKTIQENLKYLNDHPEVPIIIEMLIEEILDKQPQTSLHQFAAAYFSQPKFDLYKKIQHRLEDKNVMTNQQKNNIFVDYHRSALSVENILRKLSTGANSSTESEIDEI